MSVRGKQVLYADDSAELAVFTDCYVARRSVSATSYSTSRLSGQRSNTDRRHIGSGVGGRGFVRVAKARRAVRRNVRA